MIGLEQIVAEQRPKIIDNRQRSERHSVGDSYGEPPTTQPSCITCPPTTTYLNELQYKLRGVQPTTSYVILPAAPRLPLFTDRNTLTIKLSQRCSIHI